MSSYDEESDHRAEALAMTNTMADPRHEIYCRERFSGQSRAKSYAKAYNLPSGDRKTQASYSARGSRLEKRVPEVILRIDALNKEAAAASVNNVVVSQDYIRDKWRELIEYGTQRKEALDDEGNQILDEKGSPLGGEMVNPKEANSALNAMARSLGMFHAANQKAPKEDPSELSDEQLMRELAEAEVQLTNVRADLEKRAEIERREASGEDESSSTGTREAEKSSVRTLQ